MLRHLVQVLNVQLQAGLQQQAALWDSQHLMSSTEPQVGFQHFEYLMLRGLCMCTVLL